MRGSRHSLWSLTFGCLALTCAVLSAPPARFALSADVAFKRHVINSETDYSAAAIVDVNRDGKLDIVCGGDWYEAPNWNRHFVRHVSRIRGRPDGFAHLTLDVNRDGWTDIITVNYRSSSIKWVQHPGRWLGEWTTHIAVEPGPMETGRLVDIDGDGRVDLLPNGARFAAWWELEWDTQYGVGVPRWIRHDLPEKAGGHGLGFGDIDGDGRSDIVGQSGWLKAPEDRRADRWHWNPEFQLERASIPMIVADVDADGDNDIVWTSAHGFGVYWLEQTRGKSGERLWTRHAVDTEWSQAHAPLWVDLDGNGRNEFVAGKRYMSHGGSDPGAFDPLTVYRYEFDATRRTWQRWTISAAERVGLGLDPKARDIDGDGDLDLVASGRSGLYYLENLGAGSFGDRAVPQYEGPQLLVFKNAEGLELPVTNAEQWGRRRAHIVGSIESQLRGLPTSVDRAPLDVRVESEATRDQMARRTVSYQLDREQRGVAEVIVPAGLAPGTGAGVVCLFEGESTNRAIAEQLASRGYACIIPLWAPGDLASSGRARQVWATMRALDYLQALPEVHGERLACIGDQSGGRLAALAAALDQRIIATFMRIESAASTKETLAAIAPRAVYIQPKREDDAEQLRETMAMVKPVYALQNAEAKLRIAESSPGTQDALPGDLLPWLDAHVKRRRR